MPTSGTQGPRFSFCLVIPMTFKKNTVQWRRQTNVGRYRVDARSGTQGPRFLFLPRNTNDFKKKKKKEISVQQRLLTNVRRYRVGAGSGTQGPRFSFCRVVPLTKNNNNNNKSSVEAPDKRPALQGRIWVRHARSKVYFLSSNINDFKKKLQFSRGSRQTSGVTGSLLGQTRKAKGSVSAQQYR